MVNWFPRGLQDLTIVYFLRSRSIDLAASFDADAGAFAMTLKRSDSFAEGECIPFYKTPQAV